MRVLIVDVFVICSYNSSYKMESERTGKNCRAIIFLTIQFFPEIFMVIILRRYQGENPGNQNVARDCLYLWLVNCAYVN